MVHPNGVSSPSKKRILYDEFQTLIREASMPIESLVNALVCWLKGYDSPRLTDCKMPLTDTTNVLMDATNALTDTTNALTVFINLSNG